MPSFRTLFVFATSSAVWASCLLSAQYKVVDAAAAFVGQTAAHSPPTRRRRRSPSANTPYLISIVERNEEQHQRKRPGASPSGLSYRNAYETSGVAIAVPTSSTTTRYRGTFNTTYVSSCNVTGDLDYSQYVDNYAVWERCVPVEVKTRQTKPQQYRVFCDLDGVLVDFAHGIMEVLGLEARISSHNIDALPRRAMWDTVARAPSFFEHLPWCPGGRELWQAIAPLRPHILTGVPSYCMTAPRDEKFNWCRRELGANNNNDNHDLPHVPVRFQHVDKAARWGRLRVHATVRRKSVPVGQQQQQQQRDEILVGANRGDENDWTCQVITCWSEQKFRESGPGAVLIDDRIDLKAAWEEQGGIFIHHETGNVERTLRQLRKHGILPIPSDDDNQDDDDDDDAISYNDLWRRSSFRP